MAGSKFISGALAKSLLDGLGGITKLLGNKELAPAAGKLMMIGLPSVAAMQLMDLTPTGDVIGTYLKNKLVPGLEESNMAREMELAAKMEMGSKQLPILSASLMGVENDRLVKQQMVQEALFKKDQILAEIKQDQYMAGVPDHNIEKLLDDTIRLAPMVTMDNPSVVLSILRAAALTGADSIDVSTANDLVSLENSYSGVRR